MTTRIEVACELINQDTLMCKLLSLLSDLSESNEAVEGKFKIVGHYKFKVNNLDILVVQPYYGLGKDSIVLFIKDSSCYETQEYIENSLINFLTDYKDCSIIAVQTNTKEETL